MQSFAKEERLSSKKAIEELFKKGKPIQFQSLKVKWLIIDDADVPVKVLISVPKRLFKRAVDRNRIKRLIREAYRKNKVDLYDKLGATKVNIVLIYTSKTIPNYIETEALVIGLLQKLSNKILIS
jgi:ribonuclease P protein component